jgi:hypothetical protein
MLFSLNVHNAEGGRYSLKHDQVRSAVTLDGRRLHSRGGGVTERAGNSFPPRYLQVNQDEAIAHSRAAAAEAGRESQSLFSELKEVRGGHWTPAVCVD